MQPKVPTLFPQGGKLKYKYPINLDFLQRTFLTKENGYKCCCLNMRALFIILIHCACVWNIFGILWTSKIAVISWWIISCNVHRLLFLQQRRTNEEFYVMISQHFKNSVIRKMRSWFGSWLWYDGCGDLSFRHTPFSPSNMVSRNCSLSNEETYRGPSKELLFRTILDWENGGKGLKCFSQLGILERDLPLLSKMN